MPGGTSDWRAGARAHLALRPAVAERVRRAGGTEQAARRVAAALAQHPDVALAYWDSGLSRLVVTASTEAAADAVVERATALAERHGLARADEVVEGLGHPGDPASVRTAAGALAADVVGVAAAVTGSALRLPASPRLVTAVATMLRENPAFRRWLRARLGNARMDLTLALANAAVHGAGQSPTSLVLDGALRCCQLAEAVVRTATFETVHDQLCAPGRDSLPADPSRRPPLRTSPAQEYAAHASAGSVLGAAATLLVKHDVAEAAEAVLAGSPKAARYGPAAFHAALSGALSRTGVLVRDPNRLRQLEMAGTVVLHPSALRTPGAGADPWAEPVLDAARRAGLRVVMVEDPALADFSGLADQVVPAGRPLSEVVRELRDEGGVITVVRPGAGGDGAGPDGVFGGGGAVLDGPRGRDGAALGGSAGGDGEGLAGARGADGDVPDGASGDNGAVSARSSGVDGAVSARMSGVDGEVLAGLLGGDVAVALADGSCTVAWGADVLAPNGLPDVWRLLRAVPVARVVGRRSQTLARSGAALSGLLVAIGERQNRASVLPGLRHAPVDASAAAALLAGVSAALGVAVARPPHPRPRVAWHELDPEGVRERLEYEHEHEPEPSATEEVTARLRALADRAGRLPPLAPALWSLRLARAVRGELDDPLTPVLAVGSAAEAILGSAVDALLVVGALDLNALVGGVQRLRAEKALAGLLAGQKQKARVADEESPEAPAGAHVVDAAKLHPGDIIELNADDVVPADARLLWEDGLEVDESALTGESLPVDKCMDPTPSAPVPERHCMVFEGTTVVAGRARAVVVDTGEHTEAARAVSLAARTPAAAGVQARLQELTRKALPLTLAGGAAVTGLSLLRGAPVRQAVSGGVAVAVAAVPEGLPLVATVAQLAAARRLGRHGVLVRTPRTLEALGRMDAICFDKTGTLTENRLRLVRVADADGTVRKPGEPGGTGRGSAGAGGHEVGGAESRGVESAAVERVGVESAVSEAGGVESGGAESGSAEPGGTKSGGVEVGATESGGTESGGVEPDGKAPGGAERGGGKEPGRVEAGSDDVVRVAARACPRLDGDSARPTHATDEAILDAAGLDPGWTQEEGLPFETVRGYAAAVGRDADGSPVLVAKGAPETVLPACSGLPGHASRAAQALARDGLRIIAVAQRPLAPAETAADALERPLEELEFTGLLALADAPRETSPALVRGLREAGVRPVVLTGDHPQTARAIAMDLGWPEDVVVVTGDELAAADRSARSRMLRDADVVARVAPEQKLQVVESLRDAGRVVGMVGDGANDAAAIRAADIGVGVSARGSAAARNAADLVVTGDDLLVLTEAVREGRSLWHSVADAIAILIGGNAGEVSFGIVGTVLSGSAPLSTRQMLLVNLFTDLFPAMAVAVTPKDAQQAEEDDEGEAGAANGTEEPLGTAVLGEPLIRQIRHRALTTCLGATAAWLFGRFTPGTARRSTTMALCAVVGAQLAQTLADRRGSPLVRLTVLGSAAALIALVQTPGASQAFGCTPLGPFAWAGVAAAIALALAGQRALPRTRS
ncbi:HAD-IC family P-type ATPase [Streptomyces sp. TRM68367]|uniref:HAD-IC family P-type ATPase n=1 Tax=Streptomyces sp. TRM68367 TaxID=2758415 RepID=UPI0021D12B74|nr:HAD-IC family P-type ATPase [Streptomyces sp. TRM68367]